MRWDEYGCYVARSDQQPCGEDCAICERVCPFADGNPDEDVLAADSFGSMEAARHRAGLGYFLSCWVGFSNAGGFRERGASGGMATWFLAGLLREGIVDHVICVLPSDDPDALYRFAVCDSPEEVESASRSAYYPVECSDALRRVLTVKGRYAIICLPCTAKAIRLAMMAAPRLRQRIKCVAGLACGHGVSSFFAEYVAATADAGASRPSRIAFRLKDPERPASDHVCECVWETDDGGRVHRVHWSEGPNRAWDGHWFDPNACLFCDDLFAETADVVFMDAWLPEYVPDYRGTSIVVARSGLAHQMLASGRAAGELVLSECSPEDVIKSQSEVVQYKREGLSHRLWLAGRRREAVPVKRVSADKAAAEHSARYYKAFLAARVGADRWKSRKDVRDFCRCMEKVGESGRLKLAILHARRRIPLPLRRIRRLVHQLTGGKSG